MSHHDTLTMQVLTPAKTMEGLILKLRVFCSYHMDSAAEISDPAESLLADAERIGAPQA